jgi:ethanolamine ammonia-lyase large subunit
MDDAVESTLLLAESNLGKWRVFHEIAGNVSRTGASPKIFLEVIKLCENQGFVYCAKRMYIGARFTKDSGKGTILQGLRSENRKSLV